MKKDRQTAADELATAVERRLCGIGSRDELQRALYAYWHTVPLGPPRV